MSKENGYILGTIEESVINSELQKSALPLCNKDLSSQTLPYIRMTVL